MDTIQPALMFNCSIQGKVTRYECEHCHRSGRNHRRIRKDGVTVALRHYPTRAMCKRENVKDA